ncbi:F-box/kelch-repeat protein At3g23880-like [Trifolium pratense]|uniref:F-box/kelch-repeat protein At3g23880-like n=1 Tax=Trifolium pratense TaxID=57577 RepID=UPI001E697801|nr:F-box/kelch-repeat protein At3g23880-like [Trifolium pratense]
MMNTPPDVFLSNDLLAQILSFLTVKSLTRLRCVCKNWYSLISEPSFIKLHLHQSKRNNPHTTLLLQFGSKDIFSVVIHFPLTRLFKNPSITITHDSNHLSTKNDCNNFVGSCNGLLCFRSNPSYNIGDILLRFENPATKLSNKIRVYDCNYRKRSRVDFVFNQVRIYKYSFGYVNSNDTYKVVASCLRGKGKGTEVKVFSLGDNVWRYIQDFPVDPLRIRFPFVNDGVYVSGTINWLAIRNNEVYDWKSITIDQFVIISLDLGKETYRQLLPPRGFDIVPHVEPSVSVLMDRLCFSHNVNGKYFVIWQMKEFGVEESWTPLLKIGYSSLRGLTIAMFLLCVRLSSIRTELHAIEEIT